MSDTPRTDKLEFEQECNYEVSWEDHSRQLEREIQQKDEQIAALRGAVRISLENIIDSIESGWYHLSQEGLNALNESLTSPAPPVVSLDDFLSFMRTLPLVNHRSSWNDHIEAFAAKYTMKQEKEGA